MTDMFLTKNISVWQTSLCKSRPISAGDCPIDFLWVRMEAVMWPVIHLFTAWDRNKEGKSNQFVILNEYYTQFVYNWFVVICFLCLFWYHQCFAVFMFKLKFSCNEACIENFLVDYSHCLMSFNMCQNLLSFNQTLCGYQQIWNTELLPVFLLQNSKKRKLSSVSTYGLYWFMSNLISEVFHVELMLDR